MKQHKKIASSEVKDFLRVLEDLTLDKKLSNDVLIGLGKEIGNEIKKSFLKSSKTSMSVVVTTKFDANTFGKGLVEALTPAKLGYMDFEGRRGHAALNTPVRDLNLPHMNGQIVDNLIVAKSVLATGCTAISLAKTAINEYNPKNVIIASIYYSILGIKELQSALPNANFIYVGEPYLVKEDGMLGVFLNLPEES